MPKPIEGPVRPISLEVENVKRLSAFNVSFDKESVCQIVGDNGEGKTSALDALWWALEGAKHIQAEPIKKGADSARIRLNLGECVITRTFKAAAKDAKKTYTTGLSVATAEGAKWDEPQAVINDLLGALSMDPVAFMAQPPKQQFATLAAFVPGFDFPAFEEAQQADYDRRTQIGREYDREAAAAAAIAVPAGTPDVPADEESLADEIESAVQHNADIGRRAHNRAGARDRLAEIDRQLEALELERTALAEKLKSAGELPEPIDVEALRARHRDIRAANANIEAKQRKAGHMLAADRLKASYDALTGRMGVREDHKRAAIAAAEMPVAGLEFGDGEIRVNGEPFDQASDAEQLRISMAVAMKLNPLLRVLRVRQGDRLDGRSMRLVEDMARKEGFLVIMERVLPSPGVGMIVEIVNGTVKSITKGEGNASKTNSKK